MKRLFCVLLALTLAACAPASSGVASLPNSEPAAAVSTLTSALSSVNENGFFSYYYDPANSEAGTRLGRWDFRDGTMHIPCTVPDCDHTGAKCEARLSGYPLVVLEDAVYTLELDDSRGLYELSVRDADGTHPRLVGTLGYWNFVGADEEFLYGFCEGAYGRVSRADGTETFLVHGLGKDFSDSGRVLGVWQDRFVAVNWDWSREEPARLCLLDRDGTVTEVARIDPAHFSDFDCVLIQNEMLYLDRPTGDVMAVHVETGEVRTVSQALRPYNALEGDDFYKCQRWYLSKVQNTPIVRVVDLGDGHLEQAAFRVNEDGTVSQLPQRQEFRDYDPELGSGYNSQPEPVTVMDQWGEELVVCCAVQCFTYENEDGTFWATQNVYALTRVEDYLAGRENYREFSSEE